MKVTADAVGDTSANGPRAQVFLAYAQEDTDLVQPRTGAFGALAGVSSVASEAGQGAAITAPLPPGLASLVAQVRQLLVEAGLTIWEWGQGLPPGADLEATISRATEGCDNYVILLSPRAILEVYCLQGLLFALSLNKRIVPVQIETVTVERLPEPLQAMDLISLETSRPPLAQNAGGRQLIQTLQQDAAYHHTHTQLLVKALRWERQMRHPDLLLQGAELDAFQRWLTAARGRSSYQPIYLQALFVAASLRQASRIGHVPGDAPSSLKQTKDWLKRWR